MFRCYFKVKCVNAQIEAMVKKKQRLEEEYLNIRRKTRMLKHEEDKIRKDVLFSADVICCTLSASGSLLLHKFLKISRYESVCYLFRISSAPPALQGLRRFSTFMPFFGYSGNTVRPH